MKISKKVIENNTKKTKKQKNKKTKKFFILFS